MPKPMCPDDAKLLLEGVQEASDITGLEPIQIVANAKWCKCEFNRRYKRQIHNLAHMATGTRCRNV